MSEVAAFVTWPAAPVPGPGPEPLITALTAEGGLIRHPSPRPGRLCGANAAKPRAGPRPGLAHLAAPAGFSDSDRKPPLLVGQYNGPAPHPAARLGEPRVPFQ